MSGLLIANTAPFHRQPGKDVQLWSEIYKFLPHGVSLVDRTGRMQMPFAFTLFDGFALPSDLNGFSMSYEECCEQRVREILALQEKVNVPVALLYSGGIDSTLVLISFAKVLGPALRDKVRVFLSTDSIKENPKFYFSFIRKHCNIDSSERIPHLFDKSYIIVGGEHNDQLFGSDIVGKFLRFSGPMSEVKRPYSRESIVGFFEKMGLSAAGANAWFDLLSESADHAPCEVESVFDFFWWLNFVFKWQTVSFRMMLRMNPAQRKNIDKAFIDSYYHHFYDTTAFQKWSMLNKSKKIGETWTSYKHHAKELIHEFFHDDDYLNNKAKAGSLSRLFLQRDMALALTDDFEFKLSVDPVEYYCPENSFTHYLGSHAY